MATKLFNGDPTTLLKVMAGVNGILLAVTLTVLTLAIATFRDHGSRIGDVERDIAVIQGNRFTAADALRLQSRIEGRLEDKIDELKADMNARFDRLEGRIGGS
jgi:hypothetical protein